jgi:hypothetical protein
MTTDLQAQWQVDSETGEVLPGGTDFLALAEDLVAAAGVCIELRVRTVC